MTVDELMDALAKLPADAVVMVLDTDNTDTYEVQNVGKPEDTDGTTRVWLSVTFWDG